MVHKEAFGQVSHHFPGHTKMVTSSSPPGENDVNILLASAK